MSSTPTPFSPAYADVVLPVPVDQPFTYSVPPALAPRLAPGMRVLVPVRERIETGYVVALRQDAPGIERVRALLDAPDERPIFTPEMLQLCRWLADYYCCSWGEALQCAVPPGLRIGSELRYRLAEHALNAGRYTEVQKLVLAALYRHGTLTDKQLAEELDNKKLAGALQGLLRRGLLHAEPVPRKARTNIRTQTWACLVESAVLSAEKIAALQRRAPKQAALYLDLLHGAPERPADVLCRPHNATLPVLRGLAEKGLVHLEEREDLRAPEAASTAYGGAEKHALNAEQLAAFDAIDAALAAESFQTFLLHGVTGSGKTEVYLQAIEATRARGRQAILLVPEISLTPQTVGRLFSRFGGAIAVLHSGLSGGERYDEWRRVQRGEVDIVVGARSAVFAPLPRLGLILVDEEHDHSYKQGEAPRYHARDVAIMRAHLNGAVCVLGSATPSLESYYNSERGKSVRLTLNARATTGVLPEVTLLDLRAEQREEAGEVLLAPMLEAAIHARLAAGEQVILLLNRRGHSPVVLCPACGWVAECDHCNVSLTWHQSGGVLRCHYCDTEYPRPGACTKCGFAPLVFLGHGTQKIEDYLLRAFEGARIARMDADTTRAQGGHARILSAFAAGETDLLIGTQMLAKGHDYPGVTLVGVVNADHGLSLPDFRAGETVFQLLTQVAGRAGRGARKGEVIVQTHRPKHYAIQAAAAHDYAAFYAQEMAHREKAGFPPFRRMAQLLIDAEDPQEAERHAILLRRLVRDAREELGVTVEILGPSPALVRRIKNRHRWMIGLLARSPKALNALTRRARDRFESERLSGKVALKIDLDPMGAF